MVKEIMTTNGLVVYDQDGPVTKRYNREETIQIRGWIDFDVLDEHCETAHIEITSKCNRSCDYCYNPKSTVDVSVKELEVIIDRLADYGVFQITFGGGEPFTDIERLGKLVLYARSKGFIPCITTNGDILSEAKLEGVRSILSNVGQVNVSYHDVSFDQNIENIITKRRSVGFRIGVNAILYRDGSSIFGNKRRDDLLLNMFKDNDIHLNVLAFKDSKAKKCRVGSGLYVAYQIMNKYGIDITVDAPTVYKCMASKRFIDIHSNGDVSVCSFVRDPIGNLLEDDLGAIWGNRPKKVECPYFLDDLS